MIHMSVRDANHKPLQNWIFLALSIILITHNIHPSPSPNPPSLRPLHPSVLPSISIHSYVRPECKPRLMQISSFLPFFVWLWTKFPFSDLFTGSLLSLFIYLFYCLLSLYNLSADQKVIVLYTQSKNTGLIPVLLSLKRKTGLSFYFVYQVKNSRKLSKVDYF